MAGGFFNEDNGNKSTTRLMCFTSLIVAVLFGGYILYARTTEPNAMYIFTMFILGAFCPKLIQKVAEQKVASGDK